MPPQYISRVVVVVQQRIDFYYRPRVQWIPHNRAVVMVMVNNNCAPPPLFLTTCCRRHAIVGAGAPRPRAPFGHNRAFVVVVAIFSTRLFFLPTPWPRPVVVVVVVVVGVVVVVVGVVVVVAVVVVSSQLLVGSVVIVSVDTDDGDSNNFSSLAACMTPTSLSTSSSWLVITLPPPLVQGPLTRIACGLSTTILSQRHGDDDITTTTMILEHALSQALIGKHGRAWTSCEPIKCVLSPH
jgi:hypothetical protein